MVNNVYRRFVNAKQGVSKSVNYVNNNIDAFPVLFVKTLVILEGGCNALIIK